MCRGTVMGFTVTGLRRFALKSTGGSTGRSGHFSCINTSRLIGGRLLLLELLGTLREVLELVDRAFGVLNALLRLLPGRLT